MKLEFKKISLKEIKSLLLKNKKYSIIIFIILIMAIVVIIQNVDFLDSIAVGNDDIMIETQKIKRLQKKIKIENESLKVLNNNKNLLTSKSNEYWLPVRDGQVQSNIQKKIDSFSLKANVELKSMGTLRITSLGNDISNCEFDISCSGEMESIINFIYDISNASPKLYWGRCLLRPDNIRNPKKIHLTGSLKFISIENEFLLNLLLEQNKK